MKILLVNNIGIDYAGAEVMVRQLKEGLQEKGHDVRVLAGDQPASSRRFSDYTFKSFRANSPIRFLLLICNPFAVWALYKILKDFKPDIVHLHTISNASPFIFLPLKKIPTILTIHYHMVFDPTRIADIPTLQAHEGAFSDYFINDRRNPRYYGEKLRFFFLKHFYKNIDVTISCSKFYSKAAEESKFFNRIIVINNGIKALSFAPIKNKNNLLFLGRIDPDKGVDVLLRSMPAVIKKNPQVMLTIVGDGVLKKDCETLTKQLGIEENVIFLGYRDYKYVGGLLGEATIIVVPSVFDNFPTICLEAMFVGRPIVGSKVGGIPEMVIDEKTGLLIKSSDQKSISDALIMLLGNYSKCIDFGKAGHDYAEANFSAEIYIEKTIAVYKELL